MNRQLNRLFLWLLSVIVLSTSSFISNVVVSAAACPPGDNCGPYGVCITDTDQCANGICQRRCSCYPGYYGDDCSLVVEICPGQQTCFNGGKCYAVQESSGSSFVTAYQCDCRTASGEAAVYAGTRCEFPGEISCESGKRMSTYAFCVNGGRCRHTVNSGQSFAGCDCIGLFEGRHCQYAMGTAPQDELIYMPFFSACAGPIASQALCDVSAVTTCTDCYGTALNETMESGVEIKDCASGTTFACDTIDSCTPACGGAACSEELKAILTCITNEATNGLIESSGCDIYNCPANDTTTGGDATTDGGDATTDGGDSGFITGGSFIFFSSAPFNAITFSKFFESALLAVLAGFL